MPGPSLASLQSVIAAGTISAVNGNTGALQAPYGIESMLVAVAVTASAGAITFEVQWSNDGVNFFSADSATASGAQVKDTFAAISSILTTYKVLNVKAPYYRINWTTAASNTFGVQVGAAGFAEMGFGAPYGEEEGAQVGGPVVGAIGSTTLTAVYVQATPATMSAITAVPLALPAGTALSGQVGQPVSRLAIKLIVTANTWTTAVFGVVWSFTSAAGSTWQADPSDTFGGSSAAFTSIKEVAVKAPFYAIAILSGTPASATFTVDHCPTAI
jgi:hypothetical protein